jgi:hypothetical protein
MEIIHIHTQQKETIMRNSKTTSLVRTERTIETIEIDLSQETVDPGSEVEIVFITPDGRYHAKRVPTGWFVTSFL